MSLRSELAVASTAAIELAINSYMKLDPDAQTRLAKFSDKVIRIEFTGTGLSLFCLPHNHGLAVMSHFEGPVDTTIAGRPLALFRLALGDSKKVLFAGDVSIRGDVELGQKFKQALDQMDIDWEEHLARLTGDVIAHKTGHFAQEIGRWFRNASDRVAKNGAEYLQQETFVTPSADSVENFYQDIENLRDNVARLEARLNNLNSLTKDSQ